MQEYSITGRHVICDLHGIDFDVLNDLHRLMSVFRTAIENAGATILGELEKQFEPQGCSGVFLLSESHSGFHTYPEKGYISCCIYTCGTTIKPENAFKEIYNELKPKISYDMLIIRGEGEFKTILNVV
jgi:S-adenosylmethionine decarboxylase